MWDGFFCGLKKVGSMPAVEENIWRSAAKGGAQQAHCTVMPSFVAQAASMELSKSRWSVGAIHATKEATVGIGCVVVLATGALWRSNQTEGFDLGVLKTHSPVPLSSERLDTRGRYRQATLKDKSGLMPKHTEAHRCTTVGRKPKQKTREGNNSN